MTSERLKILSSLQNYCLLSFFKTLTGKGGGGTSGISLFLRKFAITFLGSVSSAPGGTKVLGPFESSSLGRYFPKFNAYGLYWSMNCPSGASEGCCPLFNWNLGYFNIVLMFVGDLTGFSRGSSLGCLCLSWFPEAVWTPE